MFPSTDANGNPITYAGSVTMFRPSGIHTDFGGAIQAFTPGGETIIGVEGPPPPGTAGILTQGSGDIDIYSLDSVLLGESRILTTFGGNILGWSATGNINAGRGSKMTVVYQTPLRVYDNYGNVALSPSAPSTGPGIGTLNPIPSIPPGKVNHAALQVVNAANIEVQGTTAGFR